MIGLIVLIWLLVLASPVSAIIKVGLVIPFSGIESKEGIILENWANKLTSFISNSTGIKIELVLFDTQAKPIYIPAIVKKAFLSNVQVLIGPLNPECATILVQEANKWKIPLILTAGEINPIKQIKKPPGQIFRVGLTSREAVKALYHCLKKKGYHQLGLLISTDNFGKVGETWLKAYAAEYGLNIKKIRYFSPYDTDVTAHLEALLDTEAVVCWAGPWASITVARNINQLGLKLPVYFSHYICAESLLQDYPSLTDKPFVGAAFLAPNELSIEDNDVYKLLKMFLMRENLTYDPYLTTLADAFIFLKKGLENTDPKNFVKTLENVGLIKGLTGFYFLSPDDHYGLLPATVGVFKYQEKFYKPVCQPKADIL